MSEHSKSECSNSIEEDIEECLVSTSSLENDKSTGKNVINFSLVDEQLSGKLLTPHDQPNTRGEEARESIVNPLEGTSDHITELDASDLNDEWNEAKQDLYIRSLELPLSPISIEGRGCRSYDSNIDFLNLMAYVENPRNLCLDETQIDDPLNELNELEQVQVKNTQTAHGDNDDFLNSLRQKVYNTQSTVESSRMIESDTQNGKACKSMAKVPVEFNREFLEDITEESEKVSMTIENDNTSRDFDSIISLNMMQMLENKVKDLEDIVAGKDVCLASLSMQLDAVQRKESSVSNNGRDSLREMPPSGRDSSSLITSSTEYKTLHDECGNKVFDFHSEIINRDTLIEQLTDSLQKSISVRENLQHHSEKLSLEVQQLRKQLSETLDAIKKSTWSRDQESVGQRLSEISIDLVSESDDDLDRQLLIDTEDKVSVSTRNSKERQITGDHFNYDAFDGDLQISKQIEQFQKYLNPDELRIFFMVQKKFDDFLSQEIEKSKIKYDGEIKLITEQLENEKQNRESEISRLRQLVASTKDGTVEFVEMRQELEAIHKREMEDLRTYFEKKCADLEKHYSEEIFSQKSQRNSAETSSDISEQEHFSEESMENSPRKRTREEIYASPTHRQITPTTIGVMNTAPETKPSTKQEAEPDITASEMKNFYVEKIREITEKYEEKTKKLTEKLKRLEHKYANDELLMITNENASTEGKPSDVTIDQDDINNESQEIRKIAAEYDRRLREQVALAKEDILRELEAQIQALLSETTTDDHHWPPELILLREKFTAKSQLEIAQLQIKHEEEMSKLKIDFEKQLVRKIKRNSTFDLNRDLDQIITERDNLRELSNTLRRLLCELLKCVTITEDDLSKTIFDEIQSNILCQQSQPENRTMLADSDAFNISTLSSQQAQAALETTISRKNLLIPNVSAILSVVEDQSLIDFIYRDNYECESFNLRDCVEKLKSEANYLLQLSENIFKSKDPVEVKNDSFHLDLKNVSCEDEDGLKLGNKINVLRTLSLNESAVASEAGLKEASTYNSLPADVNKFVLQKDIFSDDCNSEPVKELNFQVHELRNRLVKSETDRQKLQRELEVTIRRNKELGCELNVLREQLEQLDSQKESLCEGYGSKHLRSPRSDLNATTSLAQLQEKARNLLTSPTKSMTQDPTMLLQLIEEFCREGEKVLEEGKKDKDDLQSQIDVADKQLKATRQFLEDQAAERELERDEFVKEIDKLKYILREKEKERSCFENASREVEHMEKQLCENSQQISELSAIKDKLESDLKASIDKIFVLREIISELETQVETKSLSEHVLNEKVKAFEAYIASQAKANEALQSEIDKLKTEFSIGYQDRIAQLEEQVRKSRPSSEQAAIFGQIVEQLRDIETTLDKKTKALEAIHQRGSSNSCSAGRSEDVSVPLPTSAKEQSPVSSSTNSPMQDKNEILLPNDELQKVVDKLAKHTRVEEATIKRIQDLEMHLGTVRTACTELQHERDMLQERMSEQLVRISSLQSKLDEQRSRAEELQRQGTSELTIRIHDLKNEVFNLKETLSSRDKQIVNLKNQLEQSKVVIDRQEAELSLGIQGDRSTMEKLESELKVKTEEIRKLKDRIKNEMINKLALPDLMETMLADKNEEIDHLREQLDSKEKELKNILELDLGRRNENEVKEKEKSKEHVEQKLSARTLSDIGSISEYDEPDIIRRAANDVETPLAMHKNAADQTTNMLSSKVLRTSTQLDKNTPVFNVGSLQTFQSGNYFINSAKDANLSTPPFAPRQINFSEVTDDSKPKILCLKEARNVSQQQDSVQQNKNNDEVNILNNELQVKLTQIQELINENETLTIRVAELEVNVSALRKNEIDFKENENKLKTIENELEQERSLVREIRATLEKKELEISTLTHKINNISEENTNLSEQLKEAVKQHSEVQKEAESLKHVIQDKDDSLLKKSKDLLNYQENEQLHREEITKLKNDIEALQSTQSEQEVEELKKELELARGELSEKALLYKKCMLDYETMENEIKTFRDIFQRTGDMEKNTDLENKLFECERKVMDLEYRNTFLESELKRIRSQNSENSKLFSLDEIAEQVEKELNYSAQLDSNILKAIESEDENNLDNQHKNEAQKLIIEDTLKQLHDLQLQLCMEKENAEKVHQLLNEEKLHSQDIQQQDASIIEAMRLQLQAALDKEQELYKVLDSEREKCERLATQITVLQRTEARNSSLLLKSPTDTPRKTPRSPKISENESEVGDRYKSEIKMLKSQIERERERVADLQRVLDRERNRFETELKERIEYAENLKLEMEKISREKSMSEQELEHLQERLLFATREIESLEARISTLQDVETRRAQRRGRERVDTTNATFEIQELKLKVSAFDKERDQLEKTIYMLRSDVERGAQREAKLAEALATAGIESNLPEQFLQKLQEMNYLLIENTKENRQMAETLQCLTQERKNLQKKCDDLEYASRNETIMTGKLNELEERANHLFGKYLRVESHRKALVHQKRYLLIVLQTYQENETRALQLLNGSDKKPKRKSFKSVALIVIAIQRMKFIVKRWQTGKKFATKSIFSIGTPRRAIANEPSISWRNHNDTPKNSTAASHSCRDKNQSPAENNLKQSIEAYRFMT